MSLFNTFKNAFSAKVMKLSGKNPKAANEYRGFFSSWDEAKRQTTGYEDKLIFEKVKKAALEVKRGNAVFERDSVLFYKKIYNWPLLALLLKISHEHNGVLNLVDYGGSLGSTYFQHRDFLASLAEVRWNIIEQKHFASFGKRHFSTRELQFYSSLPECLVETKPHTLLASSFIGYVNNPFDIVDQIINSRIPNVIFDRTAFITAADHKILIQKVSPLIYDASYPMWAFNFNKFIDLFKKDHKLEISFPSYCHTDITVENQVLTWKGIYFTKR